MASNRSIVQELHQIQERCGYLPKEELEALSRRRRENPAPPPARGGQLLPALPAESRRRWRSRSAATCPATFAGAWTARNLEALAEEIGGAGDPGRGVSCLGQCDGAPAILIGEHVYRAVDRELPDLVRRALRCPASKGGRATRARPLAHGLEDRPLRGSRGLRGRPSLCREPDADGLIEALKVADLRGMGGAGVRAHQKWKDVRQAGATGSTRRQRRRERAGHVQGPRAAAAHAAPGRRGRDPGRPPDRGRAGLHLHPPRIRGADRGRPRRRSRAPRRSGSAAQTSSAPGGPSRSRSSSVPAATSAASRAR